MHIKLNNETIQVNPSITLLSLLSEYFTIETGLAAAINDRVIPHSRWASSVLNEADEISIFQAIAGG